MAELNPPGVLDGPEVAAETGAQIQRLSTTALAGDRAGVCGATHLAVSQSSTPGMSVRVAEGIALVKGSTVTWQGIYSCPNTSAVDTLAISPGDPANPRNDIVVAQVVDASYAGVDKLWQLAVVEGTPAASPTDPTLPASSLALARVRVDANESTSILNADITDLRVAGGLFSRSQPPMCRCSRTGFGLTSGAAAAAPGLTTEDLDPLGWHSVANATRITPTEGAGWYEVAYTVKFSADTDYTALRAFIAANGSTGTQFAESRFTGAVGGATSWAGRDYILLNGSTDYVELYLQQTNTSGALNTADVTLTVRQAYRTFS